MIKNRTTFIIAVCVFLFSEAIYLLTLAPTTSYWDCSEFIACANKLEVGHAPGAPVFMLLGRFFSLFAGDNTSLVAFMVNALSATASALTIVFLFLIILWFTKKLLRRIDLNTNREFYNIILYSASLIGALAYAFTDSFWFSAVEGEVYATSSLFSAMVFWCIIKWEETEFNDWRSTRWIYLIFFLLGISVGIHLLNMLTLPAIGLVYYSKKSKRSIKDLFLVQSVAILLMVVFVFVIIPGVAKGAAYFDLLFVNTLNLKVYSGAIFYLALLAIALRFFYKYFTHRKKSLVKIIVLAFGFWLAGYSSFTVLVIRSAANPFVDINNVENLFGLVDYLNREQYPMRPLVKGNSYNSPIIGTTERYTYKLYNGKYIKDELNPDYIFDTKTLNLFPRMASLDPAHVQYYKRWIEIKGRNVKVRNGRGESETLVIPTTFDNIRFFFKYQLGHMYFRYFMWNFSGRQNDNQGFGDRLNGNWITGINALDKLRLGDQSLIPDIVGSKKSQNSYYMLPLILGLAGMFFHYKYDRIRFATVLLLFLLSGAAIVLYLNEIPITPRERDYAYVGSFFAFSIWIGIGVLALYRMIKRYATSRFVVSATAISLFILVPLNLLKENYDDHDRSNRTVARDFALNTLGSLPPNSILFTYADNDTYPIWYVQEVEGYRKDVRHVLHSFLPIDWYAEQVHYNHEGKQGISLSFKGDELLMSQNSYFPVINKVETPIDLSEIINFVKNDDKRSKVQLSNGEYVDFIPADQLMLNVNSQALSATCSYIDSKVQMPERIVFEPAGQYLTRSELLTLDILVQNNWERPLFFTSPHVMNKLGLGEYLHPEGGLFRFLPFKSELPESVILNQSLEMYSIVKNTYRWGNIKNENVYLDYTVKHCVQTARYHQMLTELANRLMDLNEFSKAREIIDICITELPVERLGYNPYIPELIKACYRVGAHEQADDMSEQLFEDNLRIIEYCLNESPDDSKNRNATLDLGMYLSIQTIRVVSAHSPDIAERFDSRIKTIYSALYLRGRNG